MKQAAQLFKGETFLQNNLHVLVNRYTEDFLVPFHSHDFIEYCYVSEGSGFHHIVQEKIPVRKGMLFVIPVGIPHVFRPSSYDSLRDPLIVYNCLFDAQMMDRLSLFLHDLPLREHLASLGGSGSTYYSVFDSDGSIEGLMQNMYRELSVPGIGSTTMLHTLLSQLVVKVYRQKYGDVDKSITEAADFSQVIQYIENNISEAITLTDLARMSRWSSRHLQRKFVRHTGQSFGSYLQNVRVNKSCELLRNTEHKITTVAELVGYRDIDSFNAVFKKIVGQSPMSYRKHFRS
ncbi:AraC family transcriptional regulator [Paenibacillus alkalitolerans]|uniref:AraC family transcriptional regulator n=1 Tax=Paenibacillus alkalitolerans TaxID=2799335 RepID=UPI0018F7A89B|nr:AraC family transcriptional regulator [Paenibacillus alkalitolerans]